MPFHPARRQSRVRRPVPSRRTRRDWHLEIHLSFVPPRNIASCPRTSNTSRVYINSNVTYHGAATRRRFARFGTPSNHSRTIHDRRTGFPVKNIARQAWLVVNTRVDSDRYPRVRVDENCTFVPRVFRFPDKIVGNSKRFGSSQFPTREFRKISIGFVFFKIYDNDYYRTKRTALIGIVGFDQASSNRSCIFDFCTHALVILTQDDARKPWGKIVSYEIFF